MKLFRSGLILGMLTLIQGVQSLQAVIVTYPRETPDSVIESAKQALVKAGGIITHEYHLIKGFAAEASVSALESLSTMSTAFKPYIEEDKVVTIEGDFVGEEHQF